MYCPIAHYGYRNTSLWGHLHLEPYISYSLGEFTVRVARPAMTPWLFILPVLSSLSSPIRKVWNYNLYLLSTFSLLLSVVVLCVALFATLQLKHWIPRCKCLIPPLMGPPQPTFCCAKFIAFDLFFSFLCNTFPRSFSFALACVSIIIQ